jgi:hypothetical protein
MEDDISYERARVHQLMAGNTHNDPTPDCGMSAHPVCYRPVGNALLEKFNGACKSGTALKEARS